MKKVLIITVPRQDVTRPPGILSILSACCEQANCDYQILDLNLQMYKMLDVPMVEKLNADFSTDEFSNEDNLFAYHRACDLVSNKINQYQPDFVAISVFTYASVLATDALLKYLTSTTNRTQYQIVIGGLGVDTVASSISGSREFKNYCLDTKLVDYVITGEGEIPFVELLNGNTSSPGINTHPPVQIRDLNVLPNPSYKKINPMEYFYNNQPEILLTGSRGCVRSCTFCDVEYYWNKYVYKSGTKIADEMYSVFKDTGVNKFEFSDSLINGSIKSFREFNRRLIELRQQDPKFRPLYKGQFICRPSNQLKEIDYQEMSLAGAETLVVGIEHFSEPIRDHMKKHFNNESIDWHFSQCAKYGIKNVLLLIAGYLTETFDDHNTNLLSLKKYQKYALTRTIYSININVLGLALDQHTPLYNMRDELDITINSSTDWVSLQNPSLTNTERMRRGAELIYTAATLGYKVLHFNQKVEELRRAMKKQDNSKKIFQIVKN